MDLKIETDLAISRLKVVSCGHTLVVAQVAKAIYNLVLTCTCQDQQQ